jgi:transposase
MQRQSADDYLFVDESSTRLNMTPLYARSPKGQRALAVVPKRSTNRGAKSHQLCTIRNIQGFSTSNITLIAAMTKQGMQATMTLEGSLDGDAFEVYVENVLVPTLKPGQTVILDNLRVHQNTKAKTLIEQAGCALRFLPAYSPDLTPIECGFSKIKTVLRSLAAATSKAFDTAIKTALDPVSSEDVRGYFLNCGYLLSGQPL